MVVKKRSKRSRKKASSSKVKKSVRRHGLSKENEKVILVGVIGLLVLGILVWNTHDFPAQGQAYHSNLMEAEANSDLSQINSYLLTSCDSAKSCDLVEAMANLKKELEIEGKSIFLKKEMVNLYAVTYYASNGRQVSVNGFKLELVDNTDDLLASLENIGVVTVAYNNLRYPVTALSIN